MSAAPGIADRPASILIVDDERRNRELLEVMLLPEAFHLLTAASGEEALAIVAQQPPDLILLDIMMPGMDGNEVAARIKSNPATKNIPVIMVTALNDREARLRGLTAGAEDFITKPVDRAELSVRVRNLLRLKAYGDYYDSYSQTLEGEVGAGSAKLVKVERDSEAALDSERHRAQRYLDTAAVILLALDTAGRVTLVNEYACSILEWPADELRGRSWFETCVPSRVRAAVEQSFHKLLGGDLSIVESPILVKSGGERLIEWRNTMLRDEAGQLTGTFSSGTDITERTRATDALRIAEERMRFALEAAGVGIWDMDYATGALKWSETIEAHYGVRPGTFGGTFDAFLERVHPEDRMSVIETLGKAHDSGGDFSLQHRSIWPGGMVRSLSGAGRVLLDEHGKPTRGIGIVQDVTERRTLERQYQQAQKMEAIGQLAAGVAHDFNNLLTVILGFSALMAADTDMGNEQRTDLDEIMKAAHRASRLTRQLLAFSRQQVLNTGPLDVNKLLDEMVGMFERLLGEHIEVTLALAPSLAVALADRGQLEQVVMNLVINARDAMPGGGRVTIETADVELTSSSFPEERTVPGPYVMLSVTDTGSGMTKETQQRLFEPFFTTKETGKGTGLGLSTTYGIVKQSKGCIAVDSELGRGTTFKVYLPRAERDDGVQEARPVGAVPARRTAETVLLVEDEAGVRLLSKRILDKAGYRVLVAANGIDAEELFAQHVESIGLVVTDVVMPGCDGPELVSRLQVQAPGLRVLYMSGYAEQIVAHQAGLDHGQPFVQKPFTAMELVRQVREAFER